jgi:hypothetical protein
MHGCEVDLNLILVYEFFSGYQPAQFAAENPIWAAVGVPHAPKTKLAASSSVNLSAHASFEVILRFLRDNYASSNRVVRQLGDSGESLVLVLRLFYPG